MVKWVQRPDWDARSPKNALASMPSPRNVYGVKVHYTGGRENPAMATNHALCDDRARSVQRGHMDGNGWSDVGYSFMVCMHGYVYVGRGFGKLPAANGSGLNSGHYAVLGMVGTAGVVTPSDAMLNGIRDVIDWLRSKGVGSQIRGHRDGYATDCPGAKLYAWVKAGAPRPGGNTPTKPPKPAQPKPEPHRPDQEDDDMTKYTSLGWSGTGGKEIPAATPTDIYWDTEYADHPKGHVDSGGPSFLNGPAKFVLDAELVVSGLAAGDVVQTRIVEVKDGTDPGEILEATKWRSHVVLPSGDGQHVVNHQSVGAISKGRKLRLQIQHNGGTPALVTKAWVRMESREN